MTEETNEVHIAEINQQPQLFQMLETLFVSSMPKTQATRRETATRQIFQNEISSIDAPVPDSNNFSESSAIKQGRATTTRTPQSKWSNSLKQTMHRKWCSGSRSNYTHL